LATKTAELLPDFAPAAALDEPRPEALDSIAAALRALDKALRAFQLYQGATGSYIPFLSGARASFESIWQHCASVSLEVEEGRLLWEEHEVWRGDGRRGDLAQLFHRDGVRRITVHPGFEEAELEQLISLLATAQRLGEADEDLITLLWASELGLFEYHAIDSVVDDPSPLPTYGRPDAIDPARIRLAARPPTSRPMAGPLSAVVADHGFQFNETLHFLDPSELRVLAGALEHELQRDVLGDVLTALFDRLQDGDPERQRRILACHADKLPRLIRSGALAHALVILRELNTIAARPHEAHLPVLREIRDVLWGMARPQVLDAVVALTRDPVVAVDEDVLGSLLRFIPPDGLPALVPAAEETAKPGVRRAVWEAVERAAKAHPAVALSLLDAEPAGIATGGVRLAGRLRITGALPRLAQLVAGGHPAVRLAAIEALQLFPPCDAMDSLTRVLDDPAMEIRIAALAALAASGFRSAREPLEDRVSASLDRPMERAERIALFEAYGAVAGADAIPRLADILNGRRWFRRRQPPELRACAALALGRLRDAEAVRLLTAAASDADPVVRSAATRALKRDAR
jgi:hypothetical protein